MKRAWQLGPVLRALRGHRAAAALVAIQFGIGIAITFVAVAVGAYLRSELAETALADDELSIVELQVANDFAARRADALATIERVASVTTIDRIALHSLEKSLDDLRVHDRSLHVVCAEAGAGIARVSGLRLMAGRDFVADDANTGAAIVSRAVGLPVGARFSSRAHGPAIVVGVADDLRSHLFGGEELVVIYATNPPPSARTTLLVRGDDAVRATLRDQLTKPGQHAVVSSLVASMRHVTTPLGAVLGVLATIVATIVLVLLIGSMGLTYYLVAARTREIGLRRAMGATRRDVVRYFLLENIILTSAGLLFGAAILMAVLPTLFYEIQGLWIRWPPVVIAIAGIVGLNLLATLIPARKAAAVPPIVASRAA
jgi:putative ABC transport system permease protein